MFLSISNYLVNNLSSIVQAGLIFIATIILAKLASLLIKSNMKIASKKLGKRFGVKDITRLKLIMRLVVTIIYFIGIAFILYQFELFRRIGTLMFASASILGIILGIAAQASLANLIAGLMISFTQPVRLGDFIEIENQEGYVEEITLTYTRIKTWDNKRLIIPNKQFFDSRIINHSIVDAKSLVKVNLILNNQIDWNRYKNLIIKEVKKSKFALIKKEPRIQIVDLDRDQIKIEVFAWAKSPKEAWDFSCEIREQLLKLFNKEGLYASKN
jgi:small-conductance mechanosensitive channel